MSAVHESIDRGADAAGPSNRAFGIVFASVFGLIAAGSLLMSGTVRWWAIAGCVAFLVPAFAYPRILSPLNRVWLKFGLLLHRVVSPVVLGVMFFAVITPMGLLMRTLGKTPLRLNFDRNADTYWVDRAPPGPPPESLRDQF